MDNECPEEPELPPPSAPAQYQINLRGFSTEAEARELGDAIGVIIRGISRFIDLERLDGVTVAYDYDEALAHLDRGYEATRPLRRTDDSRLLGVAMAPAVLRDGIVKGHLVFHALVVLPLLDESSEQFNLALYIVAHECAHVEDLKRKDENFPGVILQQQINDYEEFVLEQIASATWDEYAASRSSAPFDPGQTALYEDNLVSTLAGALSDANAAIRSYRLHGNVKKVLEEAGQPLCEPIRMAAYLFGHLDGIEQDLETVPRAREALAASPYQPSIERLVTILRDLWSRRGQWQSKADLIPLQDLGRDVFALGGLFLKAESDGGLYVDIPFTPETTPFFLRR